MAETTARLKRENSAGDLVDWRLVTDATAADGVADPVSDAEARQLLAVIRDLLNGVTRAPLTAAELEDLIVTVRDDYDDGATLADQTGANNVLTFTFLQSHHLIVVQPDGVGCRADPFGGTPSSTQGIPLIEDLPNFLPVLSSQVKVYAPAQVTVAVWGYVR